MPNESITDEHVADLVRRCADAAVAFIRGDMRAYVGLIRHAEDYTLLPPFGGGDGPFFTAGEAEVELVQSYVSGDLVVLVLIERQHGV